MPIVLVVLTAVELIGGAGYLGALVEAVGGALTVGVHLALSVTLSRWRFAPRTSAHPRV